jgi:hypothetical protein
MAEDLHDLLVSRPPCAQVTPGATSGQSDFTAQVTDAVRGEI